ERFWPAMDLPRVRAWWPRVVLINTVQLAITILVGQGWNRWLSGGSLFHLSAHLNFFGTAPILYLFSSFIFYWWHRLRHESQFLRPADLGHVLSHLPESGEVPRPLRLRRLA